MLDTLNQQPPDALLALIKLHDADPRAGKIDLGVGVYRTDTGATPVFAAIKAAEQKLVNEQDSKSYLGPEGDMGFVHALMPHVFGADPTMGGRIEGMQTPGGTGAVRLAVALAGKSGIRRVLMGTPSWPNHAQIIADLGLELAPFNHAAADGSADLAALRDALAEAGPGDAVLLHGCCHNPTGIDYTEDQWDEIAALLAGSPVLPIIDLAYQGLGRGMDEDACGARKVLAAVPEALLAYSCDKNFGLYRDRVGALYVLAADPGQLPAILSNGHALARATWSMPPDHGAAAVRLVLRDEELTARWQAELDAMRARMRQVRDRLAAAGGAVPGLDMAVLGSQNGMFSMLALDKDQIMAMRETHAVYMAGSGRINIAGLTMGNIDAFTSALADVTGADVAGADVTGADVTGAAVTGAGIPG
jgi:aromatic-amino-acid transaminase